MKKRNPTHNSQESGMVIDAETLESMVNLGMSKDDVQKHFKQYLALQPNGSIENFIE